MTERTTIVLPEPATAAIEERFAAAQTELRLRRALPQAQVVRYAPREEGRTIATRVSTPFALVLTDPNAVTGAELPSLLLAALQAYSEPAAALPVTNDSRNPLQFRPPSVPYLTLRGFEEESDERRAGAEAPELTMWENGDPGMFLCRIAALRESAEPPAALLAGRTVVVVPQAYSHLWAALRSQDRSDILGIVPADARSILEFGCADGRLGSLVKQRQTCRYVGVELEPAAAREAASRIDQVIAGDVLGHLRSTGEAFDCIVGGDVLEHIEDPWELLREARRRTAKGGKLILSVPNASHGAIASGLLDDRFDYVYIGLTCVGHLRFFTRGALEDLLEMTGWETESIVPMPEIRSREAIEAEELLRASGREPHPHLMVPGFYVVASNLG
jgi:SAM-dependent methyltransferase